jgi:hypothetical protein
MQLSYSGEHYSAIKGNEILRRNLKNRCQVKETRHKGPYITLFHLYEVSRKATLKAECRIEVA